MLLKTFWMMSGNIDRIMAQKDMRSLTVAVCGQGGEAAAEFRQRLVLETGTIVKVQMVHARDEAGFQELKELAAQL